MAAFVLTPAAEGDIVGILDYIEQDNPPAATRVREALVDAMRLLAEHPGDGVDDVALARPVGSDHRGDTRLEAQSGARCEGLEAPQRQRLEVHESPGSAP